MRGLPGYTAGMKRQPVQPRRQSQPVLLRLEPDHLKLIDHAAEHLGLARAAWIRSTLLQAAREVVKQAEA